MTDAVEKVLLLPEPATLIQDRGKGATLIQETLRPESIIAGQQLPSDFFDSIDPKRKPKWVRRATASVAAKRPCAES